MRFIKILKEYLDKNSRGILGGSNVERDEISIDIKVAISMVGNS